MEEERNQGQSVVSGEEGREVEVKDRGLFDFMGKKEEKEKEKEKSEEEADLVAGMEKVRVDEVEDTKEEEKKKEGFLEKLRRSHSSSSSSSSSSDEEGGGGGEGSENKEKKKKKKGLKEKLEHKEEEKGEEEEEEEEKEPVVLVVAQEEFVEAVPAYDDDTAVTVEVVEGTAKVDGAPEGGEKKGFLEKIKEKLPGHKKPGEEPAAAAAAAAAPAVETAADECAKESNDHTAADAHEGKENKKGFLGKIMEKLPGYGKGGEEKEREPEKTSACN